ncbi:BZ3500_MvSof-1268-A1-R1_Chr10-2g02933 [Microbotryum saponariae]|uniref:BZ3500_MvSof-1268-A1-R1_Chr10-2g02933 protein n=1 Tax=Microbotryum saponariae TaxID=289078 RepID=A0A2X0KCL5_9BASI|nr:BZ3501_MvSof-1269-A2-R1_Chr10-2g02519 [Microbotryum saponariae]SDA01772.1 BZ3500_MvSof-1268-A1-R1_Chr10-2g02933 [Microbotryum saponariae]
MPVNYTGGGRNRNVLHTSKRFANRCHGNTFFASPSTEET